MADGRQGGWKGCGQVILDGVINESLALPVKVMVVGNDRVASFGDEFGNSQSERNIDWNGKGIFNDKRFQDEG